MLRTLHFFVPLAVDQAARVPRADRRATRLRWLVLLTALVPTLLLSAPLLAYSLTLLINYSSAQLGGYVYPTDFLNYYSAGRMLLEQPSNLYRPVAEAAFQRELAGGRDVYAQFQNLPHLALLFAPLAVLPYGYAYVSWCLLNLGLLLASARLLAPRLSAHLSGWLPSVVLALFFLPVAFALIDGQTSFVLLFGFSMWVAWSEHADRGGGPLWLLGWAWKPQLLPLPLLALALSRRFGGAAWLILAQVAVSGLVVLWVGGDSVQRYLELSRAASQATLARVYLPGQTLLGLAQSMLGIGSSALLAALLMTGVIYGVVVWMWWRGPRSDARRYLQYALLPVAAVITSPRANTYELTLWLASAWLLLQYTRAVPQNRALILGAIFVGWWGGNLAFASERGDAFEWGAVAGVLMIAATAWQFHASADPGH